MNKRKLLYRYLISDTLASLVVWVVFMISRKIVNDAAIFENVQIFFPNYNYLSSLILFPLSCITVHYLSGFYLYPEKHSGIKIFFTTFVASLIISIVIFFVLMLDDIVVSYKYYYYSLAVLFGLLFVFTYLPRLIIYSNVKSNYRSKKWTIPTVIIGTGQNAIKIGNELAKAAPEKTVVGYVETNHGKLISQEMILGNLHQIEKIIEKYNIQEAIIALDQTDDYQLFSIINSLYRFNIDIQFTPRLYEILTGSARIDNLSISPLVSITDIKMPDWEQSVKRTFDIGFSLLALVLLSPVLLYFMIRIKTDSKGPVFYLQERIGRYGRPFKIIKFRTMFEGAENGTPRLSNPNDNRITNIGKKLRKYRIDEIPQFINVLLGHMSIVGPRPERPYYIQQIVQEAPYYCLLYKIRPGLTSWGPIRIGYSDSIEKMIERLNYDIIYLESMSLITDLKILLLTLEIIFKGKGV